jgi:hypothetical protein
LNTLQIYRDDGLPATLVLRAAGGRAPDAFAWAVPPLVRLLDYGFLFGLTTAVERDAVPICFALLCVLAFHHYDVAYRLRNQGVAPPAWLLAVGGGWDGRLIVASALALAGVLRVGILVAAAVLGAVYAAESTASWLRFRRTHGPVLGADQGIE